ncbi:unnamed protein product [Mytilus edulis]|uniref:Glucose-methanol-choline oxidoreductase N-terminal domain-containing protein n=1 Tax=Mytilus edulis TaxID=6550 RepID=A0A8S3VIR1_MYTED|nr:unnamed protein product [Mytilus edulis]
MNVKDGKRCSTSTCYLRPALDRRNLQVFIRNNKAVGVEFIKDGKRRRIFAKHEVILSAGFIRSAQILMLSGIGPRKHLQQMKIVKEHLKRVAENSFIARMFLLQPRSKGNLRLSDNSPFSSPIIDPRYLSHPEDIEDFVRGIRLMRSLEQTQAWKSIGATLVRQDVPGHCSEQIFDSDNYWRVIGIKNLRVADASVMRYLPSGHTNAPAMMIGEKAADMIRRESVKDVLILLCGKDDNIENTGQNLKYEEPSGSKERQDILDAPLTSAPASLFLDMDIRIQNIRDCEPLVKKEKFEPESDWLKSGFDPLSVKLRKQSDIFLVNYKGEITQPSDCLPSAEEVVNGSDYDFEDLSFYILIFQSRKFNVLFRTMGENRLSW